MSNKFEKSQLKQVSEIDKMLIKESFMARLLLFLFSGKTKKMLKQAADEMEKDPNITQAFKTIDYGLKSLKQYHDSFCRRYPNEPRCKDKSYRDKFNY